MCLLWVCPYRPMTVKRACATESQVCLTGSSGSSCRTSEIVQWGAQEPSGVILRHISESSDYIMCIYLSVGTSREISCRDSGSLKEFKL